jgi:two-component system chemotaxis response regulator CheV
MAEFIVGSQSFGINVSKIREFVTYQEDLLTQIPCVPPSVVGMFLLRNRTIPLIDLRIHLDMVSAEELSHQVIIVTEFNQRTNAFLCDEINKIHRISWNNIKPLSEFLAASNPPVTGSVNIEEREVMILDLERIIGEIFPDTVIGDAPMEGETQAAALESRQEAKLVLAEDSGVIRKSLTKYLAKVGYTGVEAFNNGKAAYDAILARVEETKASGGSIDTLLNVVVSDIEMPEMDGLTLCQRIKAEPDLSGIPVIMFSSLINEQMAKKCETVGADAYTSKPQTDELVQILDGFLLQKDA